MCCDAIQINGKVYSAADDHGYRPSYYNGNEVYRYAEGSWSFYKNNRLMKSFDSTDFCIENALDDQNIKFECVENYQAAATAKVEQKTDKPDSFEWLVDDWNKTVEETPTGQFIRSPIFETMEGYKFEMRVYPNGRYSSSSDQISVYCYQG